MQGYELAITLYPGVGHRTGRNFFVLFRYSYTTKDRIKYADVVVVVLKTTTSSGMRLYLPVIQMRWQPKIPGITNREQHNYASGRS
ncbi:MAG: hypothetical protein NTV68_13675 [Methanomicrobiales archaeon]|nr:hypothetical protein [Methanomicrobiales archaeon]